MTLAFQINTETPLETEWLQVVVVQKKNTFLLYFAYSFCAPIKRSIFVAISAYINSDI